MEQYTGIPGDPNYDHRDTITQLTVYNDCENNDRYSISGVSDGQYDYEYWMAPHGK